MKLPIPNLLNVGSDVTKVAYKYLPELLAGMGITGYFVSAIGAVRVTPEAYEAVQEADCEGIFEYIKVGGKYYIKPGIGMIFSTICVISSVTVSHKRNASLAATAMMYEQLVKARHEKSEEIVGEKKTQQIEDEADIEMARPDEPIAEDGIIQTGFGNTLFYETLTGRYFRSSVERVNNSVNKLNDMLINEMSANGDDWFDLLNLPKTQISYAATWDVSNGFVKLRKPCDKFPTKSSPSGNEPCFIVSLDPGPTSKYDDLYTYRHF